MESVSQDRRLIKPHGKYLNPAKPPEVHRLPDVAPKIQPASNTLDINGLI